MKVSELKAALKEIKKTVPSIRISGLNKPKLEALYNKHKTKIQKLEESVKEILSQEKKVAKKAAQKAAKAVAKEAVAQKAAKAVATKVIEKPVEKPLEKVVKKKKKKATKVVEKVEESDKKGIVHNTLYYSAAEQVFFNPDLLRMIGGMKKDLELGELVRKVIDDNKFWVEGSDDLNSLYPGILSDQLIEELKAKKNPAYSEYVGSGSWYGGSGSHTANLSNLLSEVLSTEDILTGEDINDISLIDVEDFDDDADITPFFSDYIDVIRDQAAYNEEEARDLKERQDEGEELDYEEERAVTAWFDPLNFDYGPDVFRLKLTYKTEKQRQRIIYVLEVFNSQLAQAMIETGDYSE